eukprot:1547631-Rhodomonas_salina.1
MLLGLGCGDTWAPELPLGSSLLALRSNAAQILNRTGGGIRNVIEEAEACLQTAADDVRRDLGVLPASSDSSDAFVSTYWGVLCHPDTADQPGWPVTEEMHSEDWHGPYQ